MSSRPQEPTTDPRVPGGWKGRLRAHVVSRMPPGGRRRLVAGATVASGQDVLAAVRSVRRRLTAAGVLDLPTTPYPLWRIAYGPSRAELLRQRSGARTGHVDVRVLVLPGAGSSDTTTASLLAQTAPGWRALVVGGDHAPDPRVEVASAPDAAARVTDWLTDAGRAPVVVLRTGDRLAPDAVHEIGAALRRDPGATVVTWDDDVVTGGRHHSPRLRPSWSPELLLSEDYPGRAFAVRASEVVAAGGLGDLDSPALHWDLLLRVAPEAGRVTRLAKLLSSVPARTAVPTRLALETVQRHLDRLGLAATATTGRHGGVRVQWLVSDWPSVVVVVPTRHNRVMLESCLPALAATDYPRLQVVVVDNGGRTGENEEWYRQQVGPLDLEVHWWDRPFNYSAVNNFGAARSDAEVLVFLNDDAEAVDPGWLREMVGWALRPEIGVVGLALTGPAGEIQHEGVVLGLSGFAGHVFAGMRPGSDSLYGPTDRTRDVLAVTGACLAVRRAVFDELGGFDERFELTGSDVALGLSAALSGRRNVCSPHATVRHLESATRGTEVPFGDYVASYWRYNPWLFGGDPYWNPGLSLRSTEPRLRPRQEAPAAEYVGRVIGRDLTAYRQRNDGAESRRLAAMCQVTDAEVDAVRAAHAAVRGRVEVRTVNWYIPDIDSPFYGGINTALRIADRLARVHGVENRFVVWGTPPDGYVRSALAAAFPSLADSPVHFYDESMDLSGVPAADAGIATLWTTAYALAKTPQVARKHYLVQDFEPMFYPAGTQYALAEESYRLGLYAICNTDNLRRVYEEDYGGVGRSFAPAVDRTVFHAHGRTTRSADDPVTVFVYARPGHWRNCWELAAGALTELKRRLGDSVHVVTAGARATGDPEDDEVMEHLGLLDYRATGDLYRRCDVGLALTVSRHPSYLPLELMACGVPVVAFDNPWGHWLLEDGENSLLARRTVDGLADRLEQMCRDEVLRRQLADRALQDIEARHGDWDRALAPVYDWLCDPEGDRP